MFLSSEPFQFIKLIVRKATDSIDKSIECDNRGQ